MILFRVIDYDQYDKNEKNLSSRSWRSGPQTIARRSCFFCGCTSIFNMFCFIFVCYSLVIIIIIITIIIIIIIIIIVILIIIINKRDNNHLKKERETLKRLSIVLTFSYWFDQLIIRKKKENKRKRNQNRGRFGGVEKEIR